MNAKAPAPPRILVVDDDVRLRDLLVRYLDSQGFEVRAIPGNLSDEERAAIAEALEDTGLFTRIRSAHEMVAGSELSTTRKVDV